MSNIKKNFARWGDSRKRVEERKKGKVKHANRKLSQKNYDKNKRHRLVKETWL